MKCENCEEEHDGKYGSGRFCSSKCARSFSTKSKRDEINVKIGLANKGRKFSLETKHKISENNRNRSVELKQQIGASLSKYYTDNTHTRMIPLNEILDGKHPTYSTYKLKLRLFKEKILEKRCNECGTGDEWNGKKLSLQLDHENGINNDHRLENLVVLCPNCHTQTPTYAGKNKKGKTYKKKNIGT